MLPPAKFLVIEIHCIFLPDVEFLDGIFKFCGTDYTVRISAIFSYAQPQSTCGTNMLLPNWHRFTSLGQFSKSRLVCVALIYLLAIKLFYSIVTLPLSKTGRHIRQKDMSMLFPMVTKHTHTDIPLLTQPYFGVH